MDFLLLRSEMRALVKKLFYSGAGRRVLPLPSDLATRKDIHDAAVIKAELTPVRDLFGCKANVVGCQQFLHLIRVNFHRFGTSFHGRDRGGHQLVCHLRAVQE